MIPTDRRYLATRILIALLFLAFSLRLLFFLLTLTRNPSGFFHVDSYGYWITAENILNHSAFSQSNSPPYTPDHTRTPLYPFFLAFLRALHLNTYVIIFIQILISVLTTYVVILFTKRLTDNLFSTLIAGFLISTDVPTIVYANAIMTETLFTFLFSLSFLLLIIYMKHGDGYLLLILSSISLSLSILCRPIALYMPICIIIILIIFKRRNTKLFFVKIPVFIIVIIAVLSPWLIRNQLVFGTPFLSTIGNTNILYYRAAGVYSEAEGIPFSKAKSELKQLAKSTFPGDKEKQPLEFSRYEARIGKQIILKHPSIYIKNALKSMINLFSRPLRSIIDLQLGLKDEATSLTRWGKKEDASLFQKLIKTTSLPTLIIVMFQLVILFLIWILIIIGIVKLIQEKRYLEFSLIFIILAYFSIIASGPEAYARFRLPIMPFLAAYAAIGASYITTKRQ